MLSARLARAGLRAAPQFSVPRTAALNGLRTYATQDSPTLVHPPISLFGVNGTYATSLYTASVRSSVLDQTARSMSVLGDTLKADPKLNSIIGSPTLTTSDKQAVVQELQKLVGADKDGVLKNFLGVLAENNRLGQLDGICENFATLMGAHRGEMELNITSAQELDSKSISRIEKAVSKSELSQGKKLKVVTNVNPDVVGGLIVEVGDRTIDLSVSSKIAKLNKALTDAV